MKHLFSKVIAMILAASLLILAVGCASADPAFLKGKVNEMIEFNVAHDSEGSYSMFYPGVVDEETYNSTLEEIYEYFPVVDGYTCEMTQWNVTKSLGKGAEVYDGQFRVEFENKVYFIFVSWRSDKEASGFTGFQIVSEDEWLTAQST